MTHLGYKGKSRLYAILEKAAKKFEKRLDLLEAYTPLNDDWKVSINDTNTVMLARKPYEPANGIEP